MDLLERSFQINILLVLILNRGIFKSILRHRSTHSVQIGQGILYFSLVQGQTNYKMDLKNKLFDDIAPRLTESTYDILLEK